MHYIQNIAKKNQCVTLSIINKFNENGWTYHISWAIMGKSEILEIYNKKRISEIRGLT